MTMQRTTTGSPIAIIAVGAMLVGSIKYVNDAQTGRSVTEPGTQVRRGQCLGAFYYGGSTVIVLYPKDEVVFDSDLATNSSELSMETLVRVGWRMGARA